MTEAMLVQQLTDFSCAVSSGRHAYLWLGTREGLRSALPGQLQSLSRRESLNAAIIASVPEDTRPAEMGRAVRQAFVAACRQWSAERRGRQILVLTDVALLARYQVGLEPLFSYWIEDRAACIIVAEPAEVPSCLARHSNRISAEADAVGGYLRGILGANEVVDARER